MLEDYSGTLSEYEAKKILKQAKIPCVEEKLAETADQSVEYANDIGYPVILKVDSKDVQHKTEIGAVKDAHDEKEIRKRFDIIHHNVKKHDEEAEVNGILVEKKLDGIETIVGVKKDPVFGHIIMYGLGGIFVEVLKDVNFRVIPIEKYDARNMIEEIESKQILEGIRGKKPVDKQKIVQVLLKVSKLVENNQEIKELDINPLFVSSKEAIAADALIKVV